MLIKVDQDPRQDSYTIKSAEVGKAEAFMETLITMQEIKTN